jgi:hypothetical protein
MNPSDLPRPAQRFNEYQLRRVRIILKHFEEDLVFALSWLDHGEEGGALFRRGLVLSAELREKARRDILKGLEEVRRLAATLEFEPEFENTSRQLMGKMNLDWESLSELRIRNLQGFGEVHPQVNEILKEPAERMATIALELSKIFMQGPVDLSAETESFNPKENDQ